MISFIVIGKNESWKLTKCFESIFETVKINNVTDYEIIYVDSISTDDSISRAKLFKDIIIFQIDGKCNAAIGRNIGAKEAKGDVFVFLDGDMEINPLFLSFAFKNGKLIDNLIAGGATDTIIDNSGNILSITTYHKKDRPYYKLITGGAFIIKRDTWFMVGGMDSRFVRSEDPELGIRLASKGIKQLCLPIQFINHNNDKSRLSRLNVKLLFNGTHLYSSVLIYRKNILIKNAWIRLFKQEKSLMALPLSICLSIFVSYYFLLIYFVILFFRIYNKRMFGIINAFIYYLFRDLSSLICFFVFYPKKINNNKLKYKKI